MSESAAQARVEEIRLQHDVKALKARVEELEAEVRKLRAVLERMGRLIKAGCGYPSQRP